MANRASILRKVLAPAAALLFGLGILYWRLISSPSEYVWFDHYDLCQLELPRLQFFARSIHAGYLPLWNPHIWAGQPVLGSAQPGLLNPLSLIFASVFPLRDGQLSFRVLNWMFIVLHVLGGWFCYWFCREINLAGIPALAGGLAFASTGYFGTSPHLDLASAAAVTPLIFLFSFRLWAGVGIARGAAPLGLVLGISWLTGHHEIPLLHCYVVLLSSVAIVVLRIARARRVEWRILFGLATAFCLAVAISAVQTVPMFEFGRHARRWVGLPEPIEWGTRVPYHVHALYSMKWQDFADFIIPSATNATAGSSYLGVTILSLAVLALVHSWTESHVRKLAAIGIFGLLYALGDHTPFHRALYELLPMLDKARAPERGLYLVGFTVSALAAVGLSIVVKRSVARRNVLWIAALCSVPFAAGLVSRAEYGVKSLVAGATLILIIWNIQRRIVPRFAQFILIGLVLLEATTAASYRVAYVGPGNGVCASALTDYREVARLLKKDPPAGRVAADFNQAMTDLGDLYDLDVLESFVAAVPSNIGRLEFHTARTGELLGVTHRIGARAALPDETLIGEYARGLRLFRVKSAMPRAWIVHNIAEVATQDDLRRIISDPNFDFATTALMMQRPAPSIAPCPGSEVVRIARPSADTLAVTAALGCRGLLVISDAFYPGWRADVDGQPEPILEVFGALRGVIVGQGKHRIEMRYEPSSVYFGACVSVLGMIVFGAIVWIRFARRGPAVY